VDMRLLLPAGVAVLYALLILIVVKYHVRRSNAVHISPEMAEIHFALREGHTIVGVMETKNAMRFYIGNDVRDEQMYE
jgi:hypothetical protein